MVARLEKCRTSAEGLVDEIEGPAGTKVIANHFRFTLPVRTELCQQALNGRQTPLNFEEDLPGVRAAIGQGT